MSKNSISGMVNINSATRLTQQSINHQKKVAFRINKENYEFKSGDNDEAVSLLRNLKEYDTAMMEWLSTEPENLQKFWNDPMKCFKEATNAPDELIEKIRAKAPEMLKACPANLMNGESVRQSDEPTPKIHSAATNSTYIDYTQGWDMVAAAYMKEVNIGIKYAYEKNLLPHNFSFEGTIPLLGNKYHAHGEFDYPIISGGTGSMVKVTIRFKTLTLHINNTDITGVVLNDLNMDITTDLTYITSSGTSPSETIYKYFVNFTNREAFNSINVHLPDKYKEYIMIINIVMAEVLRGVLVGKTIKLFEVSIGGINKDYPYLIPQQIRYAFSEDTKNRDDNILGILIKTTGSTGPVQLINGVIPNGSRGSITLSNRLFVGEFVKKILRDELFIKENNLKTSGDPMTISIMAPFEYYKKVEGYTVTVDKLTASIKDDRLYLNIEALITPSSGLHVRYKIKNAYKVQITTTGATQKIELVEDTPNCHEDHEVSVDAWVWLLGFLTFGLGNIVILIVMAVIESLCPNISASQISTALKPIKWEHADIVKINSLTLDGPVRIYNRKIQMCSFSNSDVQKKHFFCAI